MPRTASRVNGTTSSSPSSPANPRLIPRTSQSRLTAARTAARMTALSPGASPPPVEMAKRTSGMLHQQEAQAKQDAERPDDGRGDATADVDQRPHVDGQTERGHREHREHRGDGSEGRREPRRQYADGPGDGHQNKPNHKPRDHAMQPGLATATRQ